MVIESYKKGTLCFNKVVKANRTVDFVVTDDKGKTVGKLILNLDFALLNDAKMGTHGSVTNPSKDQLLERLVLDTPKTSHTRYTNRFKK